MKLGVIPARGGSKRLPRKNVKEFCGKPIIAWVIESSLKSGCFDHVVVSTDDHSVASVAVAHGADVPFMRPAELADDHTGTQPVVRHAIDWFSRRSRPPELVCCMYATAPFMTGGDLRDGLRVLLHNDVDFAVSVTSYAYPVQRALRVTGENRLQLLYPENYNVRSQDLEPAFHDAAQFYWGRTAAWCADNTIFGPRTIPVVLPRHRVQDIDNEEDWVRAEHMFRALNVP